MKRLLTILVIIFSFNLVFAQSGVQVNFDQLKKKVEKSNEDTQNPKKNIKEGTWISRAELMMNVYESQILNTRVGMSVTEFTLIAGQPKERIQEEQEGVPVEKFIMDRAIFYFVNQQLERWEVLNPVVENPLNLSLESLKKAIEIDVKGKKTKDISADLSRLKNLYITEGSNSYSFKKYDVAYNHFNTVISIGSMPQLNHKDTVIYYYTGLSAQLAGKNQEAVDLYKQAIDLGYSSEGNAYFNIDEAYKALGDSDSGLSYLEQGFIKYPKNQNVLFSLINHYLTKGDDPSKILTLLDRAINDEPGNASLHFAKGTLYDKLGNIEEAVACYSKATEVNPQYFDAYYNIAAIYFNKGVKLQEEANKVPAREIEKYDELMAKSNVEFKNSLPYMLKAYEVRPNDRNTIESLKNIYFRFRTESEEMNSKFNEFNEKLKSL